MKYFEPEMSIKNIIISVFTFVLLSSCQNQLKQGNEIDEPSSILGTWKLLTGTIIQEKDTTVTDYTINQESIKIISKTHFAFFRHDLGKDSTAIFVSGGGRCQISGKKYTEHLDFCNYREWENNTFDFEFDIQGDTLTTIGVEKVESLKINRLNIEQYVRVK